MVKDIMGIGFRVFLIDDNDSLQRLSMARYQRLIDGELGERLPQYAGKRVRCAMVYLEVEGRTPQSIIRIDYTIMPLDEKVGSIDRKKKKRCVLLPSSCPLSHLFLKKNVLERLLMLGVSLPRNAMNRSSGGHLYRKLRKRL